MRSIVSLILLAGCMSFSLAQAAIIFEGPKGHVSFASPKNGATVSSPVKVVMESTVKIRPAGQDLADHKTGHHHLFIDSAPIPAGEVIPNDEKHVHFGKGQTTAEIKLEPGPHTLILQLADGAHRSYGPALSQTIHITVK